jgi:hypothetical protein
MTTTTKQLTDPMKAVASNLAEVAVPDLAQAPAKEAPAVEDAAKKNAEEERLTKLRSDPSGRYTFTFPRPSSKLPPRVQAMFQGTFTSVIPDGRKLAAIGITRANLGGGLPYDVLDPWTKEYNLAVAHLFHRLDKTVESFPEWAKDLQAIKHTDVIFELYEEVALHEATFLR